MARDPLSTSSDDSLALRVVEIFRRRVLLAVAVFAMVIGAAISFALVNFITRPACIRRRWNAPAMEHEEEGRGAAGSIPASGRGLGHPVHVRRGLCARREGRGAQG